MYGRQVWPTFVLIAASVDVALVHHFPPESMHQKDRLKAWLASSCLIWRYCATTRTRGFLRFKRRRLLDDNIIQQVAKNFMVRCSWLLVSVMKATRRIETNRTRQRVRPRHKNLIENWKNEFGAVFQKQRHLLFCFCFDRRLGLASFNVDE